MSARKTVALQTAVWVAACLLVLPAVFHWAAAVPHYGTDRYFRLGALYALTAGIALLMVRVESRVLPKRKSVGLVFLIFLLTSVVENFHSHFVDHGPSYFGFISNAQWQINTHNSVIQMNPGAVPHSYRFLPNAFVRWLELWHLQFEPSRDFYRLLFGMLLFYAVYRYARLYMPFAGAVLALVLSAIIYPIT